MRIGHGYDVHRLVPGRKLILGGVDKIFNKEKPWLYMGLVAVATVSSFYFTYMIRLTFLKTRQVFHIYFKKFMFHTILIRLLISKSLFVC